MALTFSSDMLAALQSVYLISRFSNMMIGLYMYTVWDLVWNAAAEVSLGLAGIRHQLFKITLCLYRTLSRCLSKVVNVLVAFATSSLFVKISVCNSIAIRQ